jgi:hypothetical protein
MSNQSSVEKIHKDLVVKPAPHLTGSMTKDRLMLYTFVALLILTVISTVLWWPVTTPSGWSLGLALGINAVIAVGVAVGLDALLHKVAADSQLNLMSAAVFGLIVTLSYSMGAPGMAMAGDTFAVDLLSAPQCFVYVALISMIGLVLFKKLQGLAGRKYVNLNISGKRPLCRL